MFLMFSILCVIGGIWLIASALFVMALGAASRKTTPTPEADALALRHAA